MLAASVPQHPLHHQASAYSDSTDDSIIAYDVYVPYNADDATTYQQSLRYLPRILSPLLLGVYIFLCAIMTALLIFCAVYSKKHLGLLDYINFGDSRYFVFQYLPTLLGMILLLWLIQIQVAMQRIAPFMAMASQTPQTRSKAAFLDLYPSHFLIPNRQYFESRQLVFGACSIVFWLFLFTIPLLASAFNVRYMGDVGLPAWRWLAVQGVIWATVVLYLLTLLALITLLVYLLIHESGLKWDPTSLADIVALLTRSNIAGDYSGTDTFEDIHQFRQRLWARSDRLSYWHTSRRPQDIFYGIGEEGGATRQYSLEHGRMREKPHSRGQSSSSQHDANRPESSKEAGGFAQRIDLRNPDIVRRYAPWQVGTTALLGFGILALVLLIAFYVVAFVNQASLAGFLPRVSSVSNVAGFSSANFLYSFLPALLGTLMLLLWQPLDYTQRRLAPFVNLGAQGGATAKRSILLDYPATLPVHTTIKAAVLGDYAVALTSFLSLLHISIPILAGGVFWAQWYDEGTESAVVKVSAHPPGLYALCFFLAAYALGILALFALSRVSKRHSAKNIKLPHPSMALCEIISWLYVSPLVSDPAFQAVNTKAELVERLTSENAAEGFHDGEKRPRSFTRRGTNSPPRLNDMIGDINDPHSSSTSSGDAVAAHNVMPGSVAIDPYPRHDFSGPIHATPPLSPILHQESLESRFGMGVYLGRDAIEHYGIDRVSRGGGRRSMVIGDGKGRWSSSAV
jgi:hypothetical protein